MPTKFSSVPINVAQGNTVPIIDFFDYPVFPDIGSGTVARLYWNTPTTADNSVDYYNLSIKFFDPSISAYTTIFSNNIGNVNEYYITSSLLSTVTLANYKLIIYLTACSKHGSTYNSPQSTVTVYVCKACGTYVKVEDGYKQPIMKRTIAFAKLGYRALYDEAGKVLTDEDGKILYGKTSSVQDDDTGWTPMQDFYTKDRNGYWYPSDIRYEVLTDTNGEIITDSSDSAIYTL
jgi:hypothetical protein